MNNNVFCPDCNSQDVQTIEKNMTIIDEKGLPWWAIVLLVVFYPVGIIYLLYKLYKKLFNKSEPDTRVDISHYYACRSCGREFQ